MLNVIAGPYLEKIDWGGGGGGGTTMDREGESAGGGCAPSRGS